MFAIHSPRRSKSALKRLRQLSPFRYAGGKSWLVPDVRRWLDGLKFRPSVFIEPFAGGASVGLTVAVEKLADKVLLSELDPDVAAVWKVIFGCSDADADWLFNQILGADLTTSFAKNIIETEPETLRARAFQTIIKNRCRRGGILAPGAGLLNAGENGRGLLSRWYPQTLVDRMTLLRSVRASVQFVEGNAFDVIAKNASNSTAAFFVDPPYSLGGKRAGSRLYLHNSIDHARLFGDMTKVKGQFLLTYDDASEVIDMAAANGLEVTRVSMKNTHHTIISELLITQIPRQAPT